MTIFGWDKILRTGLKDCCYYVLFMITLFASLHTSRNWVLVLQEELSEHCNFW